MKVPLRWHYKKTRYMFNINVINMKKLLILPLFIITVSLSGQVNIEKDYDSIINTKIALIELNSLIKESCYLTRSWIFIDKQSGTPDKLIFLTIKENFQYLADTLTKLSEFKNGKFKQLIMPILNESQDLINYELQLTQKLKSFDDYDNIDNVFSIIPQVEYGSKFFEMKDSILEKISTTFMLVNLEINQYARRGNLIQKEVTPTNIIKI
jgi:hypothetical protein